VRVRLADARAGDGKRGVRVVRFDDRDHVAPADGLLFLDVQPGDRAGDVAADGDFGAGIRGDTSFGGDARRFGFRDLWLHVASRARGADLRDSRDEDEYSENGVEKAVHTRAPS